MSFFNRQSMVEQGAICEKEAQVPVRISERSVREGFLCKIGKKEKTRGAFGGWRVRYFNLDFNPCRLEYFFTFADAVANKPKGVLLLGRETIVAPMVRHKHTPLARAGVARALSRCWCCPLPEPFLSSHDPSLPPHCRMVSTSA